MEIDAVSAPKRMLDRAEVLRRSGLIFLGGFAANAAVEAPAAADNRSVSDHPIHGMGYAAQSFVGGLLGARGTIEGLSSMPPVPKKYERCQYIGVVLKRQHDTNKPHPGRHGTPSAADLRALHIPIPPGTKKLAAFQIAASDLPHISGFDENLQFHGDSQTDSDDIGKPATGSDGTSYDVFVLIYG